MEDDLEKAGLRMFFATLVAIFFICALGLALKEWHETEVRKACVYKTGNPECKKGSN